MSYIFENLTGKFLISVPTLADKRFEKSVIFLCGHDENGAIGIVVNKISQKLNFKTLIRQLGIDDTYVSEEGVEIHEGGPVEVGRGFVLHSSDFYQQTTVKITPEIYLTATTDILKAIVKNEGPDHFILSLGYSGWTAGQLEIEMQSNNWIQAHSSTELLFCKDTSTLWDQVMFVLGIEHSALSCDMGHG